MRVIVIFFAIVAVTASFKIEAKKANLVQVGKKSRQCGPDEDPCPSGCMACGCAPEETWCPAGCCPVGAGTWYCCPDLMCAATAADCPFEAKKTQLVQMAKEYPCNDGWLTCPNGWCCPWADGFCCPDDWCAQTPAECP